MKTIVLALVLLLGSSALAGEDYAHMQSVGDAQPVQVSVCAATTYCPNLGTNIWCRAVGNGCTWYTRPGVFVHCEGYDAFGDWQVFHVTCY